MPWQDIYGHDAVVEQFRRILARGRLASTFLFVGPQGVGKRAFALRLAQSLFCQRVPPEQLAPCGQCEACTLLLAGTHPDLLEVAKPADENEIPVELLLGARERRMQEGLCHDLWLKPMLADRRVAIIDDADRLNEEGANALLKTLEEPPPRAVLILIGTSADRQLPTIRSRSQIMRFAPLTEELVAELLVSRGLVDDTALAQRLAEHCGGSLARAVELADPELWTFRTQLLSRLSESPLDSVALARAVVPFVDAAGKEASLRRARARQIIEFAADFYRQLGRSLAGAAVQGDAELRTTVDRARAAWPGDEETTADCTQRCLEALAHVDRYANQATLLECWLDDLATRLSGTPVPSLG